MDTDLDFPHLYEIEELIDLPGTGKLSIPILYFPRPKARPEHDGLWLRVNTNAGKSWVGVFAFGYASPPAISRIVSSPDPERVCVVSKGAAYIMKVNDPDVWEEVEVTPVLDVRSIPEYELLLFADFTRLSAYGPSGRLWRSPQLCWDDLRILEVTQDGIFGVGYDPTNSVDSRFAVDIRTGQSLLPPPRSIDGKPFW